MSDAQIFERIRQVLAKEFEITGDRVEPAAHMVDALDLDSLDIISLAQELGDEIGVQLEDDDVRGCETLGELATRVAKRVARDR